ncbi:MAG TPA: hypothetical protein VMI31_10080 [Fimbriimonadaceae bacterium]|nr:hypothetical protein [Fimbriimonadaceae bacterium]
MNFGEYLVAYSRFTRRIREKGCIEEGDERLRDVLGPPVRELADNAPKNVCRHHGTFGIKGVRRSGLDDELDQLTGECSPAGDALALIE